MKSVSGCFLLSVIPALIIGCKDGEPSDPATSTGTGGAEAQSEGGGAGGNSATAASDAAFDWPHAEGGAANLEEQLMDSCIRFCSVFEAIEAHTPCTPGARMQHGVVLDPEATEVPDLVPNPICEEWCEQSFEETPVTCAVGEIELMYCTAEARFKCLVFESWGWDDCYEIEPETYCAP